MKLKAFFILITILGQSFGFCSYLSVLNNDKDFESIETIHGTVKLHAPVLQELIKSPAMQRLKKIRQYGVADYVQPISTPYNRFDHSLGVLCILQKAGASLKEQVAGLLHDVSHTVFSHTTELLFMGSFTKGAYQDQIHHDFLTHYGLKDILNKHQITVEEVVPKMNAFLALEQELPDLCADRIEYNISAGVIDHGWTPKDIQEIHQHLYFDQQKWYFDSAEMARKLSDVSLYQTVHRWGGAVNYFISQWMGEALERALEIGIIRPEDIIFHKTDDEMWHHLNACSDPILQEKLNWIKNSEQKINITNDQHYDAKGVTKFRGLDPWVKTAQGFKRLTELDAEYKTNYLKVKESIEAGWYVTFED